MQNGHNLVGRLFRQLSGILRSFDPRTYRIASPNMASSQLSSRHASAKASGSPEEALASAMGCWQQLEKGCGEAGTPTH